MLSIDAGNVQIVFTPRNLSTSEFLQPLKNKIRRVQVNKREDAIEDPNLSVVGRSDTNLCPSFD